MKNLIRILFVLISLGLGSIQKIHCADGVYALKSYAGILGFANVHDLGRQGVTGGMDGRIVHVSTHDELVRYCAAEEPLTIIIDKPISGHWVKGKNGAPSVLDEIPVTSNKTIMAVYGARLDSICFDIKDQENIIFRNISLNNGKPDGIAFRNCHHVWIDHCDLWTCDDGLLDYTLGSSYMTVSWSSFHDHDKVSLSCSGTMHYEDFGKNRVTYHHNHYFNGTQRNPRIGYGLGHLWNNYWNNNEYNGKAGYCVGYFNGAKVLVENSFFEDVKNPFRNMYGKEPDDAAWAELESRGNIFGENVSGDKAGTGKSFDVSRFYDYKFAMQDAATVNEKMLKKVGPQPWVVNDIYGFPGNGAKNVSNLEQLKWNPLDSIFEYWVFFGESYLDTGMSWVQASAERTYNLPELKPSTTYYWNIIAYLKDGTQVESEMFQFTTGAEKASQPEPADGSAEYNVYEAYPHKGATHESCGGFATEAGKLSWARAIDAKTYCVYLGTSKKNLEKVGETVDNVFQPTEPLRLGEKYFWRVDVVKNDGTVVKGDVWSFSSQQKNIGEGRTEAEDMLRFGRTFLEKEDGEENWKFKASGDFVTVCEAGTGTLAGTYTGKNSLCNISLCYLDEKQGQATFQLRINNVIVDSFDATINSNKLETHQFRNVQLKPGDQIAIDFLMKDKMKCRVDYIEIEAL